MQKQLTKKKERITGTAMSHILGSACRRQLPARLVLDQIAYSAVFLELDNHYLILENPIQTLEELRLFRHNKVTTYFLFHTSLYRMELQLAGLTTIHNTRSLKFFLPIELLSDEKRTVRRVYDLPPRTSLTLSNEKHELYTAEVLDLSPGGLGFSVTVSPDLANLQFPRGGMIYGDLGIGSKLRLTFMAEVRYAKPQPGSESFRLKMGALFLDLSPAAQEKLNRWIFEVLSLPPLSVPKGKASAILDEQQAHDKSKKSILILGANLEDLTYWRSVLGRKYNVLSSDLNIANIRTLLSTGPTLILVYLNSQDSEKASFTRKICTAFMDRYAIAFFGSDSNERRRQVAATQISYRAFIDTSSRHVLEHFRIVDALCNNIAKPAPENSDNA